MSYRILETVTNYEVNCPQGYQMLMEAGFEFVKNPRPRPYYTKEEMLEVIGDIDAVIAGIDTFDQDIFRAARKLKLIARNGLGVDNIDLNGAKEHGIWVSNTRCSTNAVAEHALLLILALLRKLPALSQNVKEGGWERFVGEELYGKTVGLLGFGMIPQSLAEKLQAFHCQVLAYDKFPNQATADRLGVRMLPLEEVAAAADILSLHLPGGSETHHLVDAVLLSRMKQGSFLVNTARGTVTDEAAVAAALESGRLQGYAVDVFETEPPLREHPLLAMPQVICTPHCAANTRRASLETGITSAKAILDVLVHGKKPANLLNG